MLCNMCWKKPVYVLISPPQMWNESSQICEVAENFKFYSLNAEIITKVLTSVLVYFVPNIVLCNVNLPSSVLIYLS